MYKPDMLLVLRDFQSCGTVRKRRQILPLLFILLLASLGLSCHEIIEPRRLSKTLDAATI